MAERNMTVSVGANTSGFKKGVNELVAELSKFNKALVDNQYKIKDANKAISDLEKERKKLAQAMKDGKATEEQKKQYEELTQKIEQHRLGLAQLRTEQAQIKGAIAQTNAQLQASQKQLTAWGATLANLASSAIQSALRGLVQLGKSVLETGQQFSASMSEVQAVSGASEEELAQLEKTAREYGATTQFSANEAAQALKYMALAGWDTQQSMDALGGILDLAAASGMDLAAASDMVTDYLSAFSMKASESGKLADILAYAQAHANTSAAQLGEAYGNCAANLNAAGQDIETVTSMLEAMANQGLKGSEAGTALAAVMREIGSAMKNGAIEINDTKIAVQDANGNYRDLTDILTEVNAAVEGLGTAQKTAALSSVFTSRSLKGLNLILNEGIENVAGYEEALRNSNGAASEAAQTMADNLSGDIKSMNSAFDELKLKIFDSAETPLRNLVQTITKSGVPALEMLVNNLDTILPVLSAVATGFIGMKATLGISKNIDVLSKSFTALIAKIKGSAAASQQDSVAKTVESGATKVATVEQTKLNAAMAANVIGVVITLVLQLAAAFGTYSAMAGNATDETHKYTKAIEEAEQAADDSIAKTEAECKVIEQLGEKYDELRQKTNLNAAEQKELDRIAEQLAEKLGITTSELQDQSGKYADLSDKINTTITKMRELAEANAKQNLLTSAYEAQYQALDAVEEKQKEIAKYTEKYSDNQALKDYINLDEVARKAKRDELFWRGGKKSDIDAINGYQDLIDSLHSLQQEFVDCKDKADRYSQQLTTLSNVTEEGSKTSSSSAAANRDYAQSAEEEIITVEDLKGKLADYTLELERNKSEIKELKREKESLEDSGETERLEEIKERLSDLKSEQSELNEKIKEIKEEIDEATNAVNDALDKVQDSYTQWQKVIDEVNAETNKNGTISIKTLSTIQKKYPELLDLVNDYIAGIKSESDVIAALEGVYNNDVKNYQNAVKTKMMTSESFFQNLLDNNANWVNDYKDKYGIDLENFKTAQEAKVAIQAQAEERKRQELNKTLLKEADTYINSSSSELKRIGFSIKNSIGNGTYNDYNYQQQIKQAGEKAVEEFNKSVSSFFGNFYSADIDSALSGLLSNGSSGGSSGGDNKWTTSNGDGIVGTGSTRAEAHLDWIEKEKALGRLSTQREIEELKKIKQYRENSADDRYKIELKLYQAEQSLAEEKEKAEKERLDRQKEQYSLASEAYNKLINDKINALNAEKQAAKDTADAEIAAIDRQIEARKRLNEDTDRKAEIDKINAQLAYDSQLDSLSRRELERKKQDLLNEQAQIDWERKMSDKKSSITDSLNASNAKTDKAMEALKAAAESAKNYFDKLSGSQSNAQIVNNNSDTRNIKIIQNALSNNQMVDKLLKAIYSK